MISSTRQCLLPKSLVPDTFRMLHPLAIHPKSSLKPTSHPQIPKPLGPPRLLGKVPESVPSQRACSNTPQSKVGSHFLTAKSQFTLSHKLSVDLHLVQVMTASLSRSHILMKFQCLQQLPTTMDYNLVQFKFSDEVPTLTYITLFNR